jgi:hypothetical protein
LVQVIFVLSAASDDKEGRRKFWREKILKRVNLISKSRGCRGHAVHEGGFVEGASNIE